ncbi:SCD domain-containing protein [Mycena venus]|uniref:SCD domain-containing protein n=1 Tax=Mycena venus TaxID=2733690 RepID=A0A8H7CN17_9AGAR|nr:SCD domain-containing protein [Mycena venus]
MGRAGMVAEALWDDVDAVSDWETLLDVLLLDHSSATDAPTPARRGKPNGKAAKASQEGLVDEAWRLEEEEETVLIEVLVASLQHAKATAKKGEEETVTNDITRALIKGLPRLLMKHQTDQNRIANVLAIPTLMNLDLYLEMRMMTNYSNLWDDITKQFLSHSEPVVLRAAIGAFQHLLRATSLSNQNNTKVLELEDELSSALRDAVAGREEIEVAGFNEDEVIALGALCARLSELSGARDMSAWMEEDEGGKQSSAWDIVSALVERGRLGYKEEAYMVTQAIELLQKHVLWKASLLQRRPAGAPPQEEEEEEEEEEELSEEQARFREKFKEQRDSLLEKLVEFAVGTQSNTSEVVTRAAFESLINVHIGLGLARKTATALDDEVQFRCAGYVQAEIERYAETLVESEAEEQNEDEDDDQEENDSGDEGSNAGDGDEGKKKRKGKAKAAPKTRKRTVRGGFVVSSFIIASFVLTAKRLVDPNSPAQLLNEYTFIELIVTFYRAIHVGVLHVRHTAILLSHYGRLGATFDLFTKSIVEILRKEGMDTDNGDVVVVVINQALREAFTLVLDGIVSDETNVVQLAKHLVPTFVRRGAGLAVLKKLDAQYIVQIQTNALSWIAKRIAGYEANGNKKSLRVAITFFRVLIPLLAVIQSRDAMKIKAHMDQVLAQAKVEVSATSKVWEPQRAYEKRLSTIMSKDKAPGAKGRKTKAAKGDGQTTDEEETDLSEVEKMVEERETPPAAPRPRPRPRARRLPKKTPVNVDENENDDDDQAAPPSPEPATTPKPRPRARATYQSKAASKSPTKTPAKPRQQDALPSPARSGSVLSDSAGAGLVTPVNKKSRKRSRPVPDEEDDDEDGVHGSAIADDDVPAPSPTPAGDMQIRRKRARH